MESVVTPDYFALYLLATGTKDNPQNVSKDLIKQAITPTTKDDIQTQIFLV